MTVESLPHVEHREKARPRVRLRLLAVAVVAVIVAGWMTLVAAPAFHPARYQSGNIPPLPPPTVVGGGEVWLELDVTSTGAVRGTKLLRTTPPYGDELAAAAKSWRFTPAEEEKVPAPTSPVESKFRAIDSTVLLVWIVRGPTYYTAATLGDSPKNLRAAVDGTPVPESTPPASYPPLARQAGQVLIETTIGINGRPSESRVLQSAPPFDEFALDALKGWSFRAARVARVTSPVFAYVAFGFREPVAAGGLPLPPSNFPQTPPRR